MGCVASSKRPAGDIRRAQSSLHFPSISGVVSQVSPVNRMTASMAHNLNVDRSKSRESDRPRRRRHQVNDAALYVGTAIVDAHDHRFARLLVGDANVRSQGEGL